MIKIINGKTYNTDTAKKVEVYQYSHQTDFGYVYEGLYLTKKGQWFLHYVGGPMSQYGKTVGNNQRGWGEGIRLLDEAEVKEWMEQHADAETYQTYFECEEG